MLNKMFMVSVAVSTTPQTPDKSETTFNGIHGKACVGPRLVMVCAHHPGKNRL